MKSKDGQLGSTGETNLNENSTTKQTETNQKGISITAARYASEDASALVHYSIAIIEYSKLCVPLKTANAKVELIKQQQAEYEKKKQELDIEVSAYCFFLCFGAEISSLIKQKSKY